MVLTSPSRSALAAALRLVPGFSDMEMHLWMLADDVRAEAFERAIARTVKPGDVVVDLGAGTGLLSLMACRAGAARVYAIERSPILDVARSIAKANGFEDRVVFMRGDSTALSLPERADVVVSETIGAFVFSEEILWSLVDARTRLLRTGGGLIPQGVMIFLAPVESFEEGIGLLERPIRGFDYRPAVRHVPVGTMTAARRIRRRDFLAAERAVYDVDFRTASAEMDFDRALEFTAGRDGVLHGFAGFWRAAMCEGVELRCDPDGPPVHWPTLLFRLPAGLPVREGDRIRLRFGKADRPGWSWTWTAGVEPRL
ncbi:MAG: 50S ribosomal protein L11 methyltransferase [Acidobacteria bacterium]|nr:50S ribosomal protein L11 methyltransferase [Acidobacteriota bacterium]